ncbi:MAG: hypothetical protein QOG06_1070 [Gaiellaceae bacterium]|jgi:hypothetical protein|nr:hypothetical protein [Gaiellaceae bacterium]
MRAHQAVGVAAPFEEQRGGPEQLEEIEPIQVAFEQLGPEDGASSGVEKPVVKVTTRKSRH